MAALERIRPSRLHFYVAIAPMLPRRARPASLNAGVQISFAIRALSYGAALDASRAPKHAADHRLCAPRRDVIRRPRNAEGPGIHFRSCLKLRIVTKGHERLVKGPRIRHGVPHASIDKRRE